MNSLPLKPEVCDADADYWLSETKPLTLQQKHAVTEWIPVMPQTAVNGWKLLGCTMCILSTIPMAWLIAKALVYVADFVVSVLA